VLLLVASYLVWAGATTWLALWSLPLAILLATLTVTLHSSLQHEVLHGHPTGNPILNEALVFLPVGFVFPYRRFRDLHLAHHRDEFLTDPYDDPESNFLDPAVWSRLPRWQRALLRFNNSLAGRMLVGPALGAISFWRSDARLIMAGDREVRLAWALHLAGMVPLVWWLWTDAMPGWAYAVSAYAGLSILKIRTYLEHRAHDRARGRSVVIERQGLLSFLFLNNSFHAVHHSKPRVAWYRLPAIYRENRDEYLRRNDGYVFASYGEVFRRYFLHAKDPVPHPLWPRGGGRDAA
jgi:fatty acid desaturase